MSEFRSGLSESGSGPVNYLGGELSTDDISVFGDVPGQTMGEQFYHPDDHYFQLSDDHLKAQAQINLVRGLDSSTFQPPRSDAPKRVQELGDDARPDAIDYHATPTGSRFHMDTQSRVKAVMSAYAGGKSVMVLMDMLYKMQQQAPDAYGVRRSRWCIVRATYGQLRTTVLKTIYDWIPPQWCKIKQASPMEGYIHLNLADGTRVEAELILMALDRPDHTRNLQSFELTGAWINEAVEIANENILPDVFGRTGRYPKKQDAPLTWRGVLLDYNPPTRGSWLHKKFERNKPDSYALYRVPSPVLVVPDPTDPNDVNKVTFVPNPKAENVRNLQDGYGYYLEMAEAYRGNWPAITRFVIGDYPTSIGKTPVFPLFNEREHVRTGLTEQRGSVLVASFDFGLYNACTFGQFYDGRVQVLREFEDPDASLFDFVETKLLEEINTRYRGFELIATGDPSGGGRSAQNREKFGYIKILKSYGFKFVNCPTNAFAPRRDAVNWLLRRRDGFLIDSGCERLIQGMAGEYSWKTDARGGRADEADKNQFSHLADTLQYMALYFRHKGKVFSETDGNAYENLQRSDGWQKQEAGMTGAQAIQQLQGGYPARPRNRARSAGLPK